MTTTSPADSARATEHCPNCQSPLLRAYCADCGQKRPDRDDLTLRALGADAFDELLSADSRLLRTLRSLAIAPGEVVHDWFDGRRARWVAPLKLYLVTSALYFFSGAHEAINTVVIDFAQQMAKEMGTVAAEANADTDRRLEQVWTYLGFAGVFIQALLAKVVLRSTRRTIAEHVIAMLYLASPIWVAFAALTWGAGWIDHAPLVDALNSTLAAVVVVYAIVALRRAYSLRWPRAIGATVTILGLTQVLELFLLFCVAFVEASANG